MDEFAETELAEEVQSLVDAIDLPVNGTISAKKLRSVLQRNKELRLLVQSKELLRPLLVKKVFSGALETLQWNLEKQLDYYHLLTFSKVIYLQYQVEVLSEKIFSYMDIQDCDLVDRDMFHRMMYIIPNVVKILRDNIKLLGDALKPRIFRQIYLELVDDEDMDVDKDLESTEFQRLMVVLVRHNPYFIQACSVEYNTNLAEGTADFEREKDLFRTRDELMLFPPPRQAEAFLELGRYAMERGDFSDACEYYEHCIEIDPNSKINRYAFADALYHAGRYEEALVQIEDCLEITQMWDPPLKFWLDCELKAKNTKRSREMREAESSRRMRSNPAGTKLFAF